MCVPMYRARLQILQKVLTLGPPSWIPSVLYIRSSESSTRKPHPPLPRAACYWGRVRGFVHSTGVASVQPGTVCFGGKSLFQEFTFHWIVVRSRCYIKVFRELVIMTKIILASVISTQHSLFTYFQERA